MLSLANKLRINLTIRSLLAGALSAISSAKAVSVCAFLFMLYLQQEQITHDLNPQALTALALLIAEGAPANKDLMVRLILNLLASDSTSH